MTKRPKFKVKHTNTISERAIVFVQQLDHMDFVINDNTYLNGVKIIYVDIPRSVDEFGEQRKDIWAFCLDDKNGLSQFLEGQIVELSYTKEKSENSEK